MKMQSHWEQLIPPSLLAEIEAQAAAEHRSASEMLREVVEDYLRERRGRSANISERTPKEAAARILDRRKRHVLPEGETIRELMTYGRA